MTLEKRKKLFFDLSFHLDFVTLMVKILMILVFMVFNLFQLCPSQSSLAEICTRFRLFRWAFPIKRGI